jgi:hypothetical protein
MKLIACAVTGLVMSFVVTGAIASGNMNANRDEKEFRAFLREFEKGTNRFINGDATLWIPRRRRTGDRFLGVRAVPRRIPSHRAFDDDRHAGGGGDDRRYRGRFQSGDLVDANGRARRRGERMRLGDRDAALRQELDRHGDRRPVRIREQQIEVEERAGRAFRETSGERLDLGSVALQDDVVAGAADVADAKSDVAIRAERQDRALGQPPANEPAIGSMASLSTITSGVSDSGVTFTLTCSVAPCNATLPFTTI